MTKACGAAPLMLSITLCAGSAREARAQAFETETARLLPRGAFELGTAVELQRSSTGKERAVPFSLEYGLTKRVQLLVEPVAYSAILPNSGTSATGVGDLEVTGFFSLRDEGRSAPAFAGALEVKIPMTTNTLISTGEVDYTGYLIASKAFGARWDTHANLGYTVFGQPAGTTLNPIFNGALAAEYFISPKLEAYGDVLGNTSSTAEGEGGDGATSTKSGAVIPEATGGEIVGTLGMGYRPSPAWRLSLGVSYDNNSAWLIRPGVTMGFGGSPGRRTRPVQ